MNELRAHGEFPEPFLEFDEFRRFMTDYRRVGGGVTVNVGVTPEGRLNTKSLALRFPPLTTDCAELCNLQGKLIYCLGQRE